MDKVIGSVKKIVFRNEDNAYTVMQLSLDDGELLTLVGTFPAISVGETVEAEGTFTTHREYGRQFNVESAEISEPCTEDAVLDYLSSGIKGIKKDVAKKIVDKYGLETLHYLEEEPEKLAMKGFTKEKAVSAGRKYRESSHRRNIISQLIHLGIKPHIAARVFRIYGLLSVSTVQNNPYILCDELFDVPFEEVDPLAQEWGIANDASCRVKAAVEYVLLYNTHNGHTFLPKESLISVSAGLLDADDDLVANTVEEMLRQKQLAEKQIADITAVYLRRYGDSEEYIAEKLLQLAEVTHDAVSKDLIASIEKNLQIEFADLQKQAVEEACRCGVFILTGGPGTGKTTTLRGIVKTLQCLELNVLLAAPTGRAAKRMSDVTGVEALTIHRMLETGFDSQRRPHFARNEKNPIDADAVIIDEASMVDTLVFEALLRALKPETRLILVGDVDQLPPVGAGAVLRDMIKSDVFNCVALTEVFRQAKDSLIIVNAHMVNHGDYPDLDRIDSDFYFVKRDDKEEILKVIGQLVSKNLPKKFAYDPINDIQVITPTKKNELGTKAINGLLRELLNPPAKTKIEYLYIDNLFREGDKIMQVRNDYDIDWVMETTGEVGSGIYNGDIGRILSIDIKNKQMSINFDGRIAIIPFDNLYDLEPAYAITVHKSQGNEFPCVVMPMVFGSGRLATRNLLYTAITRAKNTMVMVGHQEAFGKMVDNNKELKRFSGLRYILQNKIGGAK